MRSHSQTYRPESSTEMVEGWLQPWTSSTPVRIVANAAGSTSKSSRWRHRHSSTTRDQAPRRTRQDLAIHLLRPHPWEDHSYPEGDGVREWNAPDGVAEKAAMEVQEVS
jgi:hypothetical protein